MIIIIIITSKTRVIPRTFNGFWKVYRWRSLVEGYAKFGERATHLGKTVLHTSSDLFKPDQTFSDLFSIVHTCSHLFTPVHTCSHLFTPVQNCSNSFTPQWLSTLFAQWQLLVEFFPCKSCYLSILCAIFLKLHIFAHLIESYPTVHGLSSCVEKKNIDPSGSPYYSDHVRSSHVIFCTFECSYSSVLRRILLKMHILTCLIESFPTLYGLWSCIEVKLLIPLGAHA